ncbi:MAG: hypothetical protein AUG44_16875 [Actinobacteria bacterium 13_1_20CM_3_71_11]|nr:MAG: hypothetical protein AUG44_16875 [Actinobacteria bacterium 13_1_20CM_3_71_11]
MAVRTWANTLGVGAGAGLLAGAGQLGIGYGLGILRWDQPFPTGEPWHAQLTWLAFFAGVAVVAGGYAAEWYARRSRLVPTLGVRVALALVSAVGAAVILPLTIRPAGLAHPAEGGDPRLSVALTGVAGLLIGVIAAFAALSVPAVSGSVVATVLWMWIAALISSAYTLGGGASWASARLGLLSTHGIWVPLALFAPAVLIGLAVAAIARFGGSDSRAVGASGATGPALVGLAYLIAGPGSGSGGSGGGAYRWALVAVAAGGAVSVLVAVARRPAPRTATPKPTPAAPIAEVPLGPEPEQEAPTEVLTPVSPPAAPAAAPVSPPAAPVSPPAAPPAAPVSPPAAPPAPPVAPEKPVSPAAAPAAAPVSPPAAPVSPASPPAQAEETVDLGRSDPPEGAQASKISEEPAAEPAPKKGFRLGRRKKEPKEEAPKPAAADDHLDWVNSLRAKDSPARVGGKGAAARHAAKPPEEKPEESEA